MRENFNVFTIIDTESSILIKNVNFAREFETFVLKKKVLIITYYWPPSAGSGVQRWLKFAKYLPEYDWEPIVYTPSNPSFDIQDEKLLKDIPNDLRIIKKKIFEPYKLLSIFGKNKSMNTGLVSHDKKKSKFKKLIEWLRGNFLIPDPRIFWVNPSYRYLKALIKKEDIQIVITTGPPHSVHLIGLKLRKALGIKWISDFRDPFSRLDFLDTYGISDRNRNKYYQLEDQILDKSDLVLATSYSMHQMLRPFDLDKFKTITNGYDQEDFKGIETHKKDQTWRIYHAGLLNEVRNPKNLWMAIKELISEREIDLEIHLAGIIDPSIISYLQSDTVLSKVIKIEGYKSHQEVINDYYQANLLLLLINNSDNSVVNIPGKLFEYLQCKKTVLSLGSADADAHKILENVGGHYTCAYEDKDHIKRALKSAYDNRTSPILNEESTTQFSRKHLTGILAQEMQDLLTEY